MTNTKEFLDRFRAVAGPTRAGPAYLPVQIIETWEQFVLFCEEGYHDNIYEYANDLGVRETIESLLRDETLRTFPEMAWFREKVDAIDRRFRALLQEQRLNVPPDAPWWESHALRYAGPEPAADFKAQYGAEVEIREG
jgi:hypothetical protein